MSIEIIPARIPETYAELTKTAGVVAGFTNRFHLDVNDGVFVPAVSWPCGQGQWEELEHAAQTHRLPHLDTLLYEVHLMVADPERIGELFARAGASCVIAHIEAFENIEAARHALQAWRAAGCREVGLTILLDTSLSKIESLVSDISVLQVMSIAHVGFQKQSFQEQSIDRVREIHERYPDLRISVDGGVSHANVAQLSSAGATRLVVGSAIMSTAHPEESYAQLMSLVPAV